MLSKSLFVLAALAVAINAQGNSTVSSSASVPTSSDSIPPCVIACATAAVAVTPATCTSPSDFACVCTNLQFQADALQCMKDHCSADDIQKGLQLQAASCSAVSLSPSSTATPSPRSVSFASLPATSTGSGSLKPSGSLSLSPSPSSSGTTTKPTSAATNLEAGVGTFFGAILAVVFAL